MAQGKVYNALNEFIHSVAPKQGFYFDELIIVAKSCKSYSSVNAL